ncbi:hypothetical protein B0H13DRAFT_490898 [Mycena leptocephala]|nr:hypothetical protein B0H13DRAFT_490898 [Mycena leptocephala]
MALVVLKPAPAPASQQSPTLALPVSAAAPAPAKHWHLPRRIVPLGFSIVLVVLVPFPIESPTLSAARIPAVRVLLALITGVWKFSWAGAYKGLLLTFLFVITVGSHIRGAATFFAAWGLSVETTSTVSAAVGGFTGTMAFSAAVLLRNTRPELGGWVEKLLVAHDGLWDVGSGEIGAPHG